jgi:hypothetical protein
MYTVHFANGQFFSVSADGVTEASEIAADNMPHAGAITSCTHD